MSNRSNWLPSARSLTILAALAGATSCSENNTEADASPISVVCTSVCPKLIECGEFLTQSECCAEAAIEGANCQDQDLPDIINCTNNNPSCSVFADCLNSIPCLEQ